MNKKKCKLMDRQDLTKFSQKSTLKLNKFPKCNKSSPRKTSILMLHLRCFQFRKKKLISQSKSTFLQFSMRSLKIKMSKLTAQPVSTNFHQGHKKMHDFNKRLLSYKRLIKTALNFKNLSAKLTPSKNHFSKFKRHKLMMMLKKDSQIKFKNVSSAQIISLSLIPLLKSSKPNLKAIKSQFQVSVRVKAVKGQMMTKGI